MENLAELGRQVQVVFPMHPRTRKMLEQSGITAATPGLLLTEPLSYLDFMALEVQAALVITDSGGVQEETSYLGHPLPDGAPEYGTAGHHHGGDQPAAGSGKGIAERGGPNRL